MSSDWKDKLKEVKRQLEDRKTKKVLETRAREREAERPPARKLVVSQPVKQAPRSLAPLAPPKATTELSLIRVKEAIFPPVPPWTGFKPTYNIGVDFGTSSTKVCARQHKGVIPNDPGPIYLAHLDGSDSYLCPSTVLIKNGRLYFGHQAEREETSDAVPFRHLKACLACEVEPARATAFAECSSTREPETSRCTRSFRYSHPLSASQLVTLYLG